MSRLEFPRLRAPIVQAPMAGGPSTPALAAAVSAAGGLGFLAAGYRSAAELRADIVEARALGGEPLGVNLFLLVPGAVDERALAAYAARIAAERAGADALVAQGAEAGGHRGSFADEDGRGEVALLPLLALLRAASELPLVASGGIAGGAAVAAVLAAGASAAQIGTAFMRSPEAATNAAQRAALAGPGATALTRAFTGRRARGIVNDFMREHGAAAPSAYPHVHHLTAPLRRAARSSGDASAINLWAGQAFALASEAPAGELVARWSEEARVALAEAAHRLGEGR